MFNFKDEFANKKVIITGGSGQIGSELVTAYLSTGAIVFSMDVDTPAQDPEDNKFHWFKTDISKRESIQEVLEKIYNEFGSPDILINCAGISVFTPFEDRTDEEFDQVVKVNLNGTFLMSQMVFKKWSLEKKKGLILNIGSIYGVSAADMRIYGDSGRNSPEVYAMTKAGVVHFTRYLARYAAPYGIRVNCLSPGGVFANQRPEFVENYVYKTPLGRMGEPEDMVGAAFFLTSSMSKYITGQNILVDGGFTIGD